MTRIMIASLLGLAIVAGSAQEAEARSPQPFGFGFQPFGFYQPYGVRYRSSTPTPPYFALNPPVYYGARYARPYGISPFASPPVVSPPQGFRGRLRTNFYEGPKSDPAPPAMGTGCDGCNPYVHASTSKTLGVQTAKKTGKVRNNPFVAGDVTADRLVAK